MATPNTSCHKYPTPNDVSDGFRTFSDVFGSFRTAFGRFRTFSDVFGCFRTFSDGFRTFSDGFRTFSDSFRTAFGYRGRLFTDFERYRRSNFTSSAIDVRGALSFVSCICFLGASAASHPKKKNGYEQSAKSRPR